MNLDSTAALVEDIRRGRMVILMDDEDRENEGDLVMAAAHINAEAINFMCTHARGLICLTLRDAHCRQLGLEPMAQKNNARLATHFTESIDAARGITTGISAHDRARTIQDAVAVNATAADIVTPGHVFPLRARQGGVLSRAGHTEAGCDLAHLAGLTPAAVIVEIMNPDGRMARRDDLMRFAQQHRLKIGTIADLIEYRMLNECTIEASGQQRFDTEWGPFQAHLFTDRIHGTEHLALVRGEVRPDRPTLVRVQSRQFLREIRGTQAPDSQWTAQRALARIAREECGVLVLLNAHDAGFSSALARMQHTPPTAEIKFKYDDVGVGSQILKSLNVGQMALMSPAIRFPALSGFGLEITAYVEYENDHEK